MKKAQLKAVAVMACLALSSASQAGIFFIPIPNVAKPRPLEALIEALEKSDETKAIAYVSEDKTFGSKYWVWGSYSGHVLQPEANRIAMEKCQAALANVRSQQAGGQPVYDFGSKKCELYEFTNNKVSAVALARATEPTATADPMPAQPTPTPIPSQVGSTGPSPPAAPSSIAGTWCLISPEGTSLCTFASWSACHEAKPNTDFRCQAQSSASASPATAQAPSRAPQVAPEASAAPSAAPIAPQPTAAPVPPQATDSPAAKRLRELQQLRKEGLITQEEYEQKRKAILSTL